MRGEGLVCLTTTRLGKTRQVDEVKRVLKASELSKSQSIGMELKMSGMQ